jgi:hypothetical protein
MTQATGEIADIDAAQTARLDNANSYFTPTTTTPPAAPASTPVDGLTLQGTLVPGEVTSVGNGSQLPWLLTGVKVAAADTASNSLYGDIYGGGLNAYLEYQDYLTSMDGSINVVMGVELANGSTIYAQVTAVTVFGADSTRTIYDLTLAHPYGPSGADFESSFLTSTVTSVKFYS